MPLTTGLDYCHHPKRSRDRTASPDLREDAVRASPPQPSKDEALATLDWSQLPLPLKTVVRLSGLEPDGRSCAAKKQ
jgi:hypothetical protein